MLETSQNPQTIHKALRDIPTATFVLTCAHDQYKDGIITKWVQRCSNEPPMIVVAIRKGQAIEPMLRDARAFGLCMIPNGDRKMIRLFGKEHETEDDPFLAVPIKTAVTGMPIIKQSLVWFDCLLEGHLSPESDCRLYLGQIVAAQVNSMPKVSSSKNNEIKAPSHDDHSSSMDKKKSNSKSNS